MGGGRWAAAGITFGTLRRHFRCLAFVTAKLNGFRSAYRFEQQQLALARDRGVDPPEAETGSVSALV